ncbi:MAG TPA: non-ribosomal peptide synthetase [Methylocella sp.]|jgi:amino acid adenylation domain-containing protein
MSRNDFDTVPECFQIPATEKPGFFAVRSGAERLTYAGLDARADALCGRLAAAGIAKGAFAGILLDRSISTITSFLAVLKAGGAFVPLDPSSPAQGILDIVQRHKLTCIVSNAATLRRFPQLAAVVPVIDVDAASSPGPAGRGGEAAKAAGADPACVMFTSGSTGEPKGVVIPHRAIVRLVKNPGYMQFSDDQIFLQASPLTFDASIFEIWGALLNGAELVIPDAGLLSLDVIAAAIEKQGVTTLFLTSGLFNLMIDQRPAPLRKLRYLVSGGDVMSPAHVAKAARLLNSGHFISVYGPTENTTFTTTFTAPPDLSADAPVPIGWPVAATTLRILDEEMRPVPEGSAGQLYAGGDGLALGYLNAPNLTQQKFIADPFAQDPEQRLYRTGDLVRRDETGLLHFLGRMDNQIKVNGHRIEPEHVETVLRRHLPVTDIAVVACALTNGAKHLVAFVIPLPGASLSGAAFRDAASRYLPPHMIPARLETIDAFPLTQTGKIDRLTLSRQAAGTRTQNLAKPQFAAPAEAILIDLWRHHLQLETVDVDQNFFDLGGSSLQLLGVHADIERLFPGRISIQDLFDLPTIRLLHGRLSGAPAADTTAQAAVQAALQRRARQNRARPASIHANPATGN